VGSRKFCAQEKIKKARYACSDKNRTKTRKHGPGKAWAAFSANCKTGGMGDRYENGGREVI